MDNVMLHLIAIFLNYLTNPEYGQRLIYYVEIYIRGGLSEFINVATWKHGLSEGKPLRGM
jgi:hypothetical protein